MVVLHCEAFEMGWDGMMGTVFCRPDLLILRWVLHGVASVCGNKLKTRHVYNR